MYMTILHDQHAKIKKDRGAWVVDRGSLIVGRGALFVARGTWVVVRGSLIVERYPNNSECVPVRVKITISFFAPSFLTV